MMTPPPLYDESVLFYDGPAPFHGDSVLHAVSSRPTMAAGRCLPHVLTDSFIAMCFHQVVVVVVAPGGGCWVLCIGRSFKPQAPRRQTNEEGRRKAANDVDVMRVRC